MVKISVTLDPVKAAEIAKSFSTAHFDDVFSRFNRKDQKGRDLELRHQSRYAKCRARGTVRKGGQNSENILDHFL